ncbi:MAG: hypothetical protein JNJ59_16200 [Deltaproteobacteria bacterium]|nr:hypothetical protein [Deltaproteobacteria bacterium]
MRPTRLAVLVLASTLATACGSAPPLRAPMEPLQLGSAPVLTENHFKRDVMGDVSEGALREILASPVFLEERARIGIVPVATGYAPDDDIPVVGLPGTLAQELANSGHFEAVTEVTTDWPTGGSIGGLRELAARYRVEYLLLYRHRFVDRSWTNAWAISWLTFVGGFITPSQSIEVAGVVEATLFDVKTGTLLFTAFERTHSASHENIWQNDRKRADMKMALLTRATKGLAAGVMDQVRRLVASRPVSAPRTEVGQAP